MLNVQRLGRRFASSASGWTAPVTFPGSGRAFQWGDMVECSDFGGTFSLGLVAAVMPHADFARKCTLDVIQTNGRMRRIDSNFIRFAAPLLPERPTEGLERKDVAVKLVAFEAKARESLKTNFPLFEAAIGKQLKAVGHSPLSFGRLLYEKDIASAVFGSAAEAADLYAVHLYLHSYCQKIGRDSQYHLGADGSSGPYFVRSPEDQSLVESVNMLLSTGAPLIAKFRRFVSLAMSAKLQGTNRRLKEFEAIVRVLEKAVLCSWHDSASNPFIELCKEIFKGIAPCNTAGDLLLLYQKLGLEDQLVNVDIPRVQSGLQFSQVVPSHKQPHHPPPLARTASVFDERVQFDGPAFAIDSDTTIEVDDAISIQTIKGKTWLHIHVADPSRLIPPDSAADRAARTNVSTIYLASGTYTMLPPEIGLQASLDPERPYNGTLTFSASLDADGDIDDYRVSHGVLTKLQRINYDKADEVMADEQSDLHRIKVLAAHHRSYRAARGAVSFQVPHGKISFGQYGDASSLQYSVEDGERPSGALVSECMIIAGRVAAMLAKERGIPIPFRYHADPTIEGGRDCRRLLDDVHAMGDDAPLYDRLRLLSHFHASAVDVRPRGHWAMGLDLYAKATSPLRRYFDLLLHQQLSASLGETAPPRTVERIAAILPPLYRHEQYLRRIQFASQRYWTIRYIERQLRAQPDGYAPLRVTAIPLEYNPTSNTSLVHITEYAMRAYSNIAGGSLLHPGVPVPMDIVSVDSVRQTIQLVLTIE